MLAACGYPSKYSIFCPCTLRVGVWFPNFPFSIFPRLFPSLFHSSFTQSRREKVGLLQGLLQKVLVFPGGGGDLVFPELDRG